MTLTDTKCRNAKGQIKPRKLSDGGGLHLLVNPDGAKYWRLAYRWHGKQRTLAIGVYPAVGLMEARAARDEAKRNLAADTDPSEVKQERKRAAKIATGNTFEAVAREWHENWKGARTPYYAAQILRRLDADAFPSIGHRPIAALEPPELMDMLRKVERRGVNETARRLKQLVGQIFRFAIVTGRAKRDPSVDLRDALRATGEPQRHRAMPLSELPTFLQKLESYSGERQTKLALKLVTLTFLRTTELRAGRWSELENLDENSALWRIPAERMKMRLEHLVPLSRQAVAVLRELRALFWRQPQHLSFAWKRRLHVQQHYALCPLPDGISRPRHDARFPRSRLHDLERNQFVQPRLDRTPAFTCGSKRSTTCLQRCGVDA